MKNTKAFYYLNDKKMKLKQLLLIPLIHLFFVTQVKSQTDSSDNFEMKFLRAKFTDKKSKKNILVMFQLLSKNDEQFPPIFEPQTTYSLDGAPEKTIGLIDREVSVNLKIYDSSSIKKEPDIFNFVRIYLVQEKNKALILAFSVENISKNGFDKIKFTYGFREKNNENIRRLQVFEFAPEKYKKQD
jgi:hypothetical protein